MNAPDTDTFALNANLAGWLRQRMNIVMVNTPETQELLTSIREEPRTFIRRFFEQTRRELLAIVEEKIVRDIRALCDETRQRLAGAEIVVPSEALKMPTQARQAEWGAKDVFEGLKTLLESNFADWKGMEKASEFLPEFLREGWLGLVARARAEWTRPDDAESVHDDQRLVRVMGLLNRHWFLPQKLMMWRSDGTQRFPDDHDPTKWEQLAPVMATVLQHKTYTGDAGTVEMLYVMPKYAVSGADPDRMFYDADMGYAVISAKGIGEQAERFTELAKENPSPELLERMRRCGRTEAYIESWREYSRIVVPRYPGMDALAVAMVKRTVAEEVKHGIDSLRVKKLMGKNTSSAEYRIAFGDLMVKETSDLRRIWNTAKEVKGGEAYARVISEMSAQMTAADLGGDPTLMLAEWYRAVVQQAHPDFDPSEREGQAHMEASILILELLGEETGLIEKKPEMTREQEDAVIAEAGPMNEEQEAKWLEDLKEVARELMAMDPLRVHAALRGGYAKMFAMGSIDEPAMLD